MTPRLAGASNPRWKGGRWVRNDGYVMVHRPEHPRACKGHVMEHILVAEGALGRDLAEDAVVHHVNGIRSENAGHNLVLCQDRAYHNLIHYRARAREACGHAGWLKCWICGKYDAPENMWHRYTPQVTARHRACAARRKRERKAQATQARGARPAGVQEGSMVRDGLASLGGRASHDAESSRKGMA